MKRTKSAFTIIEILIAMLILFMAITFSNMSIRAFNNYQKKSQRYQNFYVTVLTLKEWMYSLNHLKEKKYSGSMNGLTYSINVMEVIRKKNYIFTPDGNGQNNGNYWITLYELELKLKNNIKEKKYTFLLTKQRRVDAKK